MPADPDPAAASEPTPPRPSTGPYVLVDLYILIAARDQDALAQAVRASVATVAGTAELGPARWRKTIGGEDLVHQWHIEQAGAPLAGRRVRRLTMSVQAEGITDLLEEIVWAAIDAICPTAREENQRLDAGETAVPTTPDQYPWSSGTRAVNEEDD